MKTLLSLILGLLVAIPSVSQKPLLNLRYQQNYTPTYYEIIEMYRQLDEHYINARLIESGQTDSGKPLHSFVINNDTIFDPALIKAQGKTVLIINNGIHAGEPCGIDASLKFADLLLCNTNDWAKILENTVVVIIPAYSVGGVLNRSTYHRTGQTTPYETGFRGNAGNLDLNRDFVKCDSENAKAFNRLYSLWDPDVFLDTHTTNGSQHQYYVTLIAPSPDMFPPTQENYIRKKLLPALYQGMATGKYELIPYVSWMYPDPKQGIKMTRETPRYSSGYAALFHSYGMMTENHVYKPYADRVESCFQFIVNLALYTSTHSSEILESRQQGLAELQTSHYYPIDFKLDTTQFELLDFKGYEAIPEQISPFSGLPRFGYDLEKPYSARIKFFNTYTPTDSIRIPEYYILPQAWKRVIERLQWSRIKFTHLPADTALEVEVYYIDECSHPSTPNNGHFFHEKVSVKTSRQKIQFYAGDLLIPVRQKRMKYLLETLEPKAADSFFRWNFFDAILDAREYFSNYGFEKNAIRYLETHPEFRQKFEAKKASDPEFAKNHRAQLAYIYYNTEWAEKSYRRYPVARIFDQHIFTHE